MTKNFERIFRVRGWVATLGLLSWLSVGAQPSKAEVQDIFRAGNGVSQPTLISKVEPTYVETARKLGAEGTVVLQVVIRPNGSPENFKVIRSLGYGLDERAIEAVTQWRFNPGMKDGNAVSVLATIEVNFRLLDRKGETSWHPGAMLFAVSAGVTPPIAEEGTMPKPNREFSDESVTLEFTVSQSGSVANIHAIHGSESAAELLTHHLAAWRFRPAMNGNGPVEAIGRMRFVKGKGDDAAKAPLAPPTVSAMPSEPQPKTEEHADSQSRPDDQVYNPGNGVSEPTLVHRVEAEYSKAAREARTKGVVVLRIVVNAEGNVVYPEVITSLGFGLDEKALEAVRQWKFRPGYKNGKPVSVAKTVEISFVMQ
jgi:TonB family protein